MTPADPRRRAGTLRLHLDETAPDTLPTIDDDDRTLLVARVGALVTELGRANADRETWWYTGLSARDRLTSELIPWLQWLTRLQRLLASSDADVRVAVPHPVLLMVAARTARATGWRVAIDDGSRWRARMALGKRRCRTAIDRMRFLATALGLLVSARRHRGGHDATDADVVVVTIFGTTPPIGPWSDPYFGSLPRWLATQGERVVVAAHVRGTSGRMVRAARGADPPVIPLAGVATFGDWLRAATARVSRVHVPPTVDVDGALVRAALAAEGPAVAMGVLLRGAIARLLRRHPRARVVQLFEGNPWERAVVVAARREGERHVTGYLHCAVVPAHLKLHMSEDDITWTPLPDRIVCTGPEARRALLQVGAFPPDRVVAGAALRPAGLGGARRSGPPSTATTTTILVLLEGIVSMVDLLRVVDEATPLLGDARVVVRPHPTLSLRELADRAGPGTIDLARFVVSTNARLEDDLADASVVIYKATTAALSAGWYGIPLVHVDTGEVLDDDPLFMIDDLKHIAIDARTLASAIDAATKLDGSTYRAEADALHAYVEAYLVEPDDRSMMAFTRDGASR